MNQKLGKQNKRVSPDEFFSAGPMQMARYGRLLAWQSNWSEDDFAKAQAHACALLPGITAEIDSLIADIIARVRSYVPDSLLRHSWWFSAMKHIKLEAEADMDMEHAVALRMIDYIQSIIVSALPAENQTEITEPEWEELQSKVEELFFKVNINYQICATATRRAGADFDVELEEFRFKAQIYWTNVRGRRYQYHDPQYIKEMFLPHAAVIEELWGISGEVFCEGLIAIWHKLTFGIQDGMIAFQDFRTKTLAAMDAKLASLENLDGYTPQRLMAEVLEENGWKSWGEQAVLGLFGMDIFDLRKNTQFPDTLLDALSWAPGEDTDFLAEGEFKGWPLRIWPVMRRPFLKIDQSFYCFDIYSLFDNIYRVMQRLILRLKPDYAETWKIEQTRLSEHLPTDYFLRLLPGATVWHSVYYQGDAGNGKKEWCEADALVAYDDHLFVLECRGGAFTYTSPTTDFNAYIDSLKNLVLKPANQGQRFLNYVKSADEVQIYDVEKSPIGLLRQSDFRNITLCPITLDPFTEIAAQVQHLKKVGVDVGTAPVWAISLDDLRAYADLFNNPLIFLHYVEKRMDAFRSATIESNDELDHVGLYFKHNNYAVYADELVGKQKARLGFNGYRADIDRYFRDKMYDATLPSPLRQESFPKFDEIIAFLADSNLSDRAKLSSYLLNMCGETREMVSSYISKELAEQPASKRCKPLTVHGRGSSTIYCYSPFSGTHRREDSILHTRAAMLAGEEDEKVLLELSYNGTGHLTDVTAQWLTTASIPAEERAIVHQEAEKLISRRIKAATQVSGKIGRNDQCPCGSGRKYKKCCINGSHLAVSNSRASTNGR